MSNTVNLGATRAWLCSRARGRTLEIGCGAGLNLPHYPREVELTGVDLNPRAVRKATATARRLGIPARFREADALALPFMDESFDTVVASFTLCAVADVDAALHEALRVLAPGGTILLADHILATSAPLRALQRTAEPFTSRMVGEHFTRRPGDNLAAMGVTVVHRERRGSMLEVVHATKA